MSFKDISKKALPLLIVVAASVIVHYLNVLPNDYQRAPLGVGLGALYAGMLLMFITLPLEGHEHRILTWGAPLTLLLIFAHLAHLIPLNLENFHIFTNVNRVSLLTGMTLGTLWVIYIKEMSRRKIKALGIDKLY